MFVFKVGLTVLRVFVKILLVVTGQAASQLDYFLPMSSVLFVVDRCDRLPDTF